MVMLQERETFDRELCSNFVILQSYLYVTRGISRTQNRDLLFDPLDVISPSSSLHGHDIA